MDNNETAPSEWAVAIEVWERFTAEHPELALRPGRWHLVNFMRRARPALLACDAIRKVKNRHWIAHRQRFGAAAFEILTSTEAA